MKTKYIFAALALTVATASCTEDWLATESRTSLLIDTYYDSEERITEALVAAYSPMHYFDLTNDGRGVVNTMNPLFLSFDVMSDDVYPGGELTKDDQPHMQLAFNFAATPNITYDGMWAVAYEGVNAANAVAQYMPDVQGISEPSKALILAEAVVLRNFYYNILWKMWGNIPYYEINLSAPYIQEQSAPDVVYDNMVTSLEEVLDSDALPMKVSDPSLQGRVSWAMGAMLYAEIVMYQNDNTRYGKALGYMERIISSGEYELMDNFADIFEQSGEWSRESIFEINYFSRGQYRSWSGRKNVGGTIYPTTIGVRLLKGSSKFANETECYGSGTLTQSAGEMYAENDLRKDASVYNPAAEGATYEARRHDTGYFMAKYLPRTDGREGDPSGDIVMAHNNNMRIYRFSETLLNAAELLARGATGNGSAADYLTRVRTRAGLDAVNATIDNIIEERHLEFLGEGKRYWDLVRSDKAKTVLTPANDAGGYRKNPWTASKKYLPIPQSEIDAAQGTLVQNNY